MTRRAVAFSTVTIRYSDSWLVGARSRSHFISQDYKFRRLRGRLNVPRREKMIRIFLLVSTGPKKITRDGENTVGTYRALRNMDKAIEPRSVSFQFPGAPFSMGSSPSLSSTPPHHPPPSTTFQFILSCWLARFTTKFPLARRSSLHTLYLPLPPSRPSLLLYSFLSAFLTIFDPLS